MTVLLPVRGSMTRKGEGFHFAVAAWISKPLMVDHDTARLGCDTTDLVVVAEPVATP